MEQKVKEIVESPLCTPITEDGATKILTNFNKALRGSSNKKVQASGEFGEENIETLAKGVVKMRCEGIIDIEKSDG